MKIVVTSKANQKLLVSSNYYEIGEFCEKNRDAKFRTLDWTAKLKILNKREFLTNLLNTTKDLTLFFKTAQLIIMRYNNLYDYMVSIGKKDEFLKYKNSL